MNIGELYDAYAEIERLPFDARAAEGAAAKRRSDALARLDERASRARQVTEAAKANLRADLRSEAQAASSRGAIPKSGTEASGSEPNFRLVRSLREKLEGLLAEKARASQDLDRLRSNVHALESQIAEELRTKGLWARAQRADVVTSCVGGLGVALSIICGPVLPGVAILMVTLAIVGYRLRGPSAVMMRASQKRPALGTHQEFRLGYILSVCGWGGVMALAVSGFLARQNIDAYWYLGLVATVGTVAAGHNARRRAS